MGCSGSKDANTDTGSHEVKKVAAATPPPSLPREYRKHSLTFTPDKTGEKRCAASKETSAQTTHVFFFFLFFSLPPKSGATRDLFNSHSTSRAVAACKTFPQPPSFPCSSSFLSPQWTRRTPLRPSTPQFVGTNWRKSAISSTARWAFRFTADAETVLVCAK